MTSSPYLSIIIPTHNEALNLRETVFQVIRYGEHELHGRYEILLVENGSTDNTMVIAEEMQHVYTPVRAFHIEGRSKAEAVRIGMLMAHGDYRYMCDCDLSTPIGEVTNFLRFMRDGWDVVIGSREHPDSKVETSFKRWFMGRVFQGIVRAVLPVLDYRDTQCGFKLFTARAANEIFTRMECKSMAFDVEALYLAFQLGFYCTDMPVAWRNDPNSRVRLIRDSWLMLRDVLRIRQLHADVVPSYKQKKIPA
ncbi:MAG: glycosyltransferase [Chloroflexi bacterium]|nr:glycosyltransferase [Chloroflexota bacterium]